MEQPEYTLSKEGRKRINKASINNAVEIARKHGFCQGFVLFALSLSGYDVFINTGGYWASFWLLTALFAMMQANNFKSKSEGGIQL